MRLAASGPDTSKLPVPLLVPLCILESAFPQPSSLSMASSWCCGARWAGVVGNPRFPQRRTEPLLRRHQSLAGRMPLPANRPHHYSAAVTTFPQRLKRPQFGVVQRNALRGAVLACRNPKRALHQVNAIPVNPAILFRFSHTRIQTQIEGRQLVRIVQLDYGPQSRLFFIRQPATLGVVLAMFRSHDRRLTQHIHFLKRGNRRQNSDHVSCSIVQLDRSAP